MRIIQLIAMGLLCAVLLTAGGCNDRQGDTGTTNGHTTEKSISGDKIRQGHVPTDHGTIPQDMRK
jgi:hypothetical protein